MVCLVTLIAATLTYGGVYRPRKLYLTHDEEALALLTTSDMATDDSLHIGSSTTNTFIVAFTDLECPACHQFLPPLINEAKKSRSACLIVRHFPLSIHKDAYMLAVACEIARRHGVGAEFIIATSKEGVIPEKVCRKSGFPLDEALVSMRDNTPPAKDVMRDLNLAHRLHLQGTPMFFYARKGQRIRLIEPEEAVNISRNGHS